MIKNNIEYTDVKTKLAINIRADVKVSFEIAQKEPLSCCWEMQL